MAGIEVFVHAAGIPAEQLFLLVPRERTFGGHRLLEDGVALLLESKQDFFGQRARLTERDEICAAFAFQVRKHTSRMESRNKMTLVVRVIHGCSAGVPACELRRRPAASPGDTHRDGARTRSRGRPRYAPPAGGRI